MSNSEKNIPPEIQKEQLYKVVEKLYNPNLPYHNFEHAKMVAEHELLSGEKITWEDWKKILKL